MRRQTNSKLPIAGNELPRFIFVYGTLKRGFGNHRLLNGCDFVGEAKTKAGEFTMIALGGFPGMIETPKGERPEGTVSGEIYEVTDSEDLRRLDGLEGHPDWYRRTQVTVYNAEGPVVLDTYVYLSARGNEAVVESGVWETFEQRRVRAIA